MLRRQPRRIGEALRRIDVLALVDGAEETLVPVEHRDLEIRLHARRHFAAPVGGDGLEQQTQQVRPAPTHLVEDGARADQRRQAAAFRRLQAQQADDVAGIGVEGLTHMRLVDADAGVLHVQPEIAHMTQHMPLGVLRAGIAEMRAQSEERQRRLTPVVALDRQATQQHEAAALQQSAQCAIDLRLQAWQRKIGGRQRRDVGIARQQRRHRRIDLGDVVGIERHDPIGPLRHRRTVPGGVAGLLGRQFD